MAVAVDPFSFATAELSQDYIRIFPDPDIVPRYLAQVSDKTGVHVLAGSDSISIKGSWVSLKRAHSILTEFLASYRGGELEEDVDKKDIELVNKDRLSRSFSDDVEDNNVENFEEYDQKPASGASFHDTAASAGEPSDWLKWTAEVLPQIQGTRSKRTLEYCQPKSEPNKVPEPLVLYANCQPTPDPTAKIPPTLDAIEKVLKMVYDKDRVKTSEQSNESESVPCSVTANDPGVGDYVSPRKVQDEGFTELSDQCAAGVSDTFSKDTNQNQLLTSASANKSEHNHDVSIATSISTRDHQGTVSTVAVSAIPLSVNGDPVSDTVFPSHQSLPEHPGNAQTNHPNDSASVNEQNKALPVRKSKRKRKRMNSRNCVESSKAAEDVNPATEFRNLDYLQDLAPLDTKEVEPDASIQTTSVVKKTKRQSRPRNGKRSQSEMQESELEVHSENLKSSRAERAAKCKCLAVAAAEVEVPEHSAKKKSRRSQPKPEVIVKAEDKGYVCELCSYVAKKLSHLREHKRRVHITKEFKCDDCGKIFGFRKDLKRHYLTHQKAENCCDICGKMYKGVRNLAEHKKTHETDYIKPEFPCEFCEKIFSTKYVLAYHIKSEHVGIKKTYLCPTCGKSFSQKNSYFQHANVHMGIKPHQCDICGRSFSYEKSLKEHKYMHQDDKQFECHVCHKKFRQSSGVAIHMKIHKERKDYVCSACGKGFSQKQAMIRHERIHVGEKPFACSLCKRTFTDSSILRRHMILIHKKDKDKWREDTENNVQRRTDFFISVVGKDGKVEKSETGGQGVENHPETNQENSPVLTQVDRSAEVAASDSGDNSSHSEDTEDFKYITIRIGPVTSQPSLPHMAGSVISVEAMSLPQHLQAQHTDVSQGATDTDPMPSVSIHDPHTAVLPIVHKLQSEAVFGMSFGPSQSKCSSPQSAQVSSQNENAVNLQEESSGILNYTLNDPACLPSSEYCSGELQQSVTSAGKVPMAHYSDSEIMAESDASRHSNMVMMSDTLTALQFHTGAISIPSASQVQTDDCHSLETDPSVQQQQQDTKHIISD